MPNYKGNEATLTKYRPKWRSGDTQTIRVPIALVDQILAYAHQIDEGVVKINTNSLVTVIELLETVEQTPRNNFSKEKKALVRQAIEQLKSLSQVNN